MLEASEVAYLGLDVNAEAVAEDRKRGMTVFYGDAGRLEVLRAAGLERAAAVVITLDNSQVSERARWRALKTKDSLVGELTHRGAAGACSNVFSVSADLFLLRFSNRPGMFPCFSSHWRALCTACCDGRW